jgi:hypothetical protein
VALCASPQRPGLPAGPRVGFRWTRENIAYAIDLWHRTHLRAPTALDWQLAGEDHPSTSNIRRVFGSWNAAMRAAGFTAVKPGGRRLRTEAELDPLRQWPRERILIAIRLWVLEHGALPTLGDWRTADPCRPSATTVQRRFGSWNGAISAAGYVPRERTATLRQNLNHAPSVMSDRGVPLRIRSG